MKFCLQETNLRLGISAPIIDKYTNYVKITILYTCITLRTSYGLSQWMPTPEICGRDQLREWL